MTDTSIPRPGLHRRHLIAGALAATASGALAQDAFPSRHVTLIVPFSAGGSTDVLARLIADGMGRHLGQQVIVENVAGAGGTLGGRRLLQAPADGYTLLIGNTGTLAAYSAFHKTKPYDSTADFAAIASVGDAPQLLVARKDFPATTLEEFTAYASANQEKLNFGSAGPGSGSFLGGTLVNSRLGLSVKAVSYRSSGDALNAILGGSIDYMSESTTAALPFVEAGQMKAIAVLRPTRIAVAPDLQASGETRYPKLLYTVWNALVCRQGTNEAVLAKLNASVRASLASDTFKDRTTRLGIEIPSGEAQTPSGAKVLIATEAKQWTDLLSSARSWE